MFRMNVVFSADNNIFSKDSLEFLKKFELWDWENDQFVTYECKNIYDVVTRDLTNSPDYRIDIEVWPSLFYDYVDGKVINEVALHPEDVFSAIVNHFKEDELTILVYADPDKFENSEYNIPDKFDLPYYKYVFKKNDFEEDELAEGKIRIGLDFDCAYVYDFDNDRELQVGEIDGVDEFRFY